LSDTYADLTETVFPDAIDIMVHMSDMNSANKSLMDQYYAYINAGNFTSAQQLLTDNPTLDAMIFNAAKFNKSIDMSIAQERWLRDGIKPYMANTFANKGAYNSGTTYYQGNVVSYNGDDFICNVSSSVGVSPLPILQLLIGQLLRLRVFKALAVLV